jgi:hypothetical protein
MLEWLQLEKFRVMNHLVFQSDAMCLYLQEERRMSLPKYKVHDETSQVSSDLPFLKLRRVCFCKSNPFGRLYLYISVPDPIVSVLRGTTVLFSL